MLEELLSQSWTQWVALITGLTYVVLAAKANNLCWVFGIVSCGFIAWDDFTEFHLYADGVLQILYVILGIIGLVKWMRSSSDEPESFSVKEDGLSRHALAVLGSAILAWPLSLLLARYTDAAFGYSDSLTTLLSIYATILLIRKVKSNWIYWIVIDVIYVYIFARTGGLLISVLYAIFAIVAVYGYLNWRTMEAPSIKTTSK